MISFIIPAWNEERLLGGTLAALDAAVAGLDESSEVLVVDDGSTDRTAEVAAAGGARVVPVHHRQIAASRNAGAREARGDRLFFIDADTRVNAAVLQAALHALDDGAVGGGATVELDADAPRSAQRVQRLMAPLFRRAGIAGGAFLFCTRAAFDAAGGFDETRYAGEDLALGRALARLGRFVVLREPVVTSARKLHSHGVLEHAWLFLRFGVLGQRKPLSRRHHEFWYGRRDHDDAGDDPRR